MLHHCLSCFFNFFSASAENFFFTSNLFDRLANTPIPAKLILICTPLHISVQITKLFHKIGIHFTMLVYWLSTKKLPAILLYLLPDYRLKRVYGTTCLVPCQITTKLCCRYQFCVVTQCMSMLTCKFRQHTILKYKE